MQSKTDSFMEAITNTFIGWFIAFLTGTFVHWLMDLPVSATANLKITLIFTVVSVIRSYCLRRAFNGKSVWQTVKGKFV